MTSNEKHHHSTNPFNQQARIIGVKHIVAISSGKGGVGKSTVATNLALALSKKFKVGLLDADIFGPSIPRMLGALRQNVVVDENSIITPLVRYGIKIMSVGFLVDENSAIVWRGPMLFKAIDQFLNDVLWGELDFLLVDLPPGTGDVPLSLVQKVPLSGAVAVTTPQNVALADVKKSIDMFERLEIPILGTVENMSYLINNGEKVQLFPKGELNTFLANKGIEKLGEIPFHPNVGLSGEAGIPVVESHPKSLEAEVFFAMADKIAAKLIHEHTEHAHEHHEH